MTRRLSGKAQPRTASSSRFACSAGSADETKALSHGVGSPGGSPPRPLPILPTTLVGSWSQPNWLIDRTRLDGHVPVRVTDHSLWRIDDAWLDEAQDDATIVAVVEQDRLGLDIVTDGEARRESYSNRFANALDGIDHERPGEMLDRTGKRVPAPRVVGPISRARPVERDVVVLTKRFTDKPVKITLPGPFTMTQQAQNDPQGGDGSGRNVGDRTTP